MFGGGGLDPRKMEQMMKQMGIDVEEVDATEVVIRTTDADLVFENPEVTKMDARGQETFQVVGSPTEQSTKPTESDTVPAVPEEDIQTVVDRTGASRDAAREALEANDGDLIAAVADLE
ncbi:MAG: nascent polypeptide-associated complex protein [Salinarchaeum sp.]